MTFLNNSKKLLSFSKSILQPMKNEKWIYSTTPQTNPKEGGKAHHTIFFRQQMTSKENEFLRQTMNFFPNILATRCRRPLIFQTLNYVRSSSQSLKYRRFKLLDCKDKGIRKFEFVAKTQFLYHYFVRPHLFSSGIVKILFAV